MVRRLITLLFICLAGYACAQPADVTNHAIPIGRGPGVIGWGEVGPCAANQTTVWSGTTSDPACGSAGGLTGSSIDKTTTYVAVTGDCGSNINLGGSSFYTLTINAASGYISTCMFLIQNVDTGRGKTIAINGITSFVLWPKQTVLVWNDNNTWRRSPDKQRWQIRAGVTFFVNASTGSNSNDGLASGAPFLTAQRAIDVITTEIDSLGNNNICSVSLAAGTYLPEFQQTLPTGTITGASWAGGNVTFTQSTHGYFAGYTIKVTGMSPSGYNGIYVITSTTTNTWTAALASNPGTATVFGSALPGVTQPWVLFQSGWEGGCSIIISGANQATTSVLMTGSPAIQTQYGTLSAPITVTDITFSSTGIGAPAASVVLHQVPGGLFFRNITIDGAFTGTPLFKNTVQGATIAFNGGSSAPVTIATGTAAQIFTFAQAGTIDATGTSAQTFVIKNVPTFSWFTVTQSVGFTRYQNVIFQDQNGKTRHPDNLTGCPGSCENTVTGTTTNGAATVTSLSINTSLLSRGMPVLGPGIAAGTVILSCGDTGPNTACGSSTSLTLSANCVNGAGPSGGNCGAASSLTFELAFTAAGGARSWESSNGVLQFNGNFQACNNNTSHFIPGTVLGIQDTGGQCL